MLFHYHSVSFDDFGNVTYEEKISLLEWEGSLLSIKGQSSFDSNITLTITTLQQLIALIPQVLGARFLKEFYLFFMLVVPFLNITNFEQYFNYL